MPSIIFDLGGSVNHDNENAVLATNAVLVAGTVIDTSGAVVPGVSFSLAAKPFSGRAANDGTNIFAEIVDLTEKSLLSMGTTVTESGAIIAGLPPGNYTVDFFGSRNLATSYPATTSVNGQTPIAYNASNTGNYAAHSTSDTITLDGATDLTFSVLKNTGNYGYANRLKLTWTETNADPQLDTPQADLVLATDQTVNIDIGANFRDVNLGDTLTFSVSPALPSGLVLSANTGILSNSGAITITAATNYTFYADDGNGGTPASDVVNITIIAAAFRIDSISDSTPGADESITIGIANPAGTVTASATSGAITVDSQTSSQVVLTTPNPLTHGDKTLNFLDDVAITLSDGTTTVSTTIQIQPAPGYFFGYITNPSADGIYANDTGAIAGVAVYYRLLTGDAVLDVATGLVIVTQNSTIEYALKGNGVAWSAFAVATITVEMIAPVIALLGANPLTWIQGQPWVDPGATVTDNVDPPRIIVANAAPDISVVGVNTIAYSTTDVAGNIAAQVNRIVNVVAGAGTPTQFVFTDVANAAISTLYENIQPITGVDAGQTLTATNGLVSNDNQQTWGSSCTMVIGQTYVKAAVTTGGSNAAPYTQIVTVNGVSDTFTVTTIAAVTRTFSIGSSDPLVDQNLDNYTGIIPICEAWTDAPEDGGVLVDSAVNTSIVDGVGSVSMTAVQAGVIYLVILRNSRAKRPTVYFRAEGQFV